MDLVTVGPARWIAGEDERRALPGSGLECSYLAAWGLTTAHRK